MGSRVGIWFVGTDLTEEDRAKGLTVQSRDVITYHVIFGPIEVESPYLWRPGQSSKPVKDQLGLTHQKICGKDGLLP